ncbi:citrate lyase [Rhodococcus sp. MH15]|uniref:HpcH/HpaI aldolase/citrate lyase family protein n=1 Tax=unclassified Rhodococcus (in: high G+C Gram-positive bacteria) TaxID=192944 RepID=UPI000718234D|nr:MULTISPECIES: aldolase/citrate lyase family protein [unclassified Rhodococcus (in: high G+C Gram-positive bacteria)]MBW0294640.1 citrate lyase [Rhodococcus sp. MH15]
MSAPLRSFLIVAGDDEKKLGKVAESGADAVILDLDDSVSAARKSIARGLVGEFLSSHADDASMPQLWVRVNSFGTGSVLTDLAATVTSGTSGIMIPEVDGPADVLRVHHYVEALEKSVGLEPQGVKLMPVVTKAALRPFGLGDYSAAAMPRLYGLTWGAGNLDAALWKATNLTPEGNWTQTSRLVRLLALNAARATGVEAVETFHVDTRDAKGLAESSRRARAEGFSGRIAIHPAQVRVINEAFTPTTDEIDSATHR